MKFLINSRNLRGLCVFWATQRAWVTHIYRNLWAIAFDGVDLYGWNMVNPPHSRNVAVRASATSLSYRRSVRSTMKTIEAAGRLGQSAFVLLTSLKEADHSNRVQRIGTVQGRFRAGCTALDGASIPPVYRPSVLENDEQQ
jgi:hypothetical protein